MYLENGIFGENWIRQAKFLKPLGGKPELKFVVINSSIYIQDGCLKYMQNVSIFLFNVLHLFYSVSSLRLDFDSKKVSGKEQ